MRKETHFLLGADTSRLLAEIARERLLYKGDLSGAVSAITESLIGCPEDIAFKVVTGEYQLDVVEDTMEETKEQAVELLREPVKKKFGDNFVYLKQIEEV